MKSIIIGAMFMALSNYSFAALLERMGGAAFYDDVSDLTWASSALLPSGTIYDDGNDQSDGRLSYSSAISWVNQLSIFDPVTETNISGWRLPAIENPNNINVYHSGSELALLLYSALGNDPNNSGTFSFGPLSGPAARNNSGANFLWFGDQYTGPVGNSSVLTVEGSLVREPSSIWPPSLAWGLNISEATQGPATIELNFTDGRVFNQYGYVLAVQSGDVGTIPIPAAAWLFGSGLIGLIGIRKFNKDV